MKVVALGEVAEINPKGPRAGELEAEELVDFVPMSDVRENGTMVVTNQRSYSEVSKGYTAFKNGDIIMAKITPCYENNKIAVARVSTDYAFGSTEYHVIRANRNKLFAPYLAYLLRQDDVRDAGEKRMTGSGGQRRVPKAFLETLEIPLPPLEEQKRIATILDQADALRRLRARALDCLNALGQAIFHEMFGDPVENRQGISKRPLGDIVRVSSGNGLVAKDMQGGSFPVYGGNGINGWHEAPTHPAGTIVIGRVGAYCGAVHVTDRPAWVTDNALAVTKKIPIDTTYLAFALQVANLNQYAGRAAQPLVSGSRIYPIEILFPSSQDQASFAKRIETQVDLLSTFQRAAIRGETLFTSLQHRAFRGEL